MGERRNEQQAGGKERAAGVGIESLLSRGSYDMRGKFPRGMKEGGKNSAEKR